MQMQKGSIVIEIASGNRGAFKGTSLATVKSVENDVVTLFDGRQFRKVKEKGSTHLYLSVDHSRTKRSKIRLPFHYETYSHYLHMQYMSEEQ